MSPFWSLNQLFPIRKFSTFIQWALDSDKYFEKKNQPANLHYIDGFLFLGPKCTSQCADTMTTFTNLCSNLNIPIARDRTDGPATIITFLGIEFDTFYTIKESRRFFCLYRIYATKNILIFLIANDAECIFFIIIKTRPNGKPDLTKRRASLCSAFV